MEQIAEHRRQYGCTFSTSGEMQIHVKAAEGKNREMVAKDCRKTKANTSASPEKGGARKARWLGTKQSRN